MAENDTAIRITPGLITASMPKRALPMETTPTPMATPMMPPQADRIADSVRNWISTSRHYRGNSQVRSPMRKALLLHFLNRLTAEEVEAVDMCAKAVFGPTWCENN